MIRFILVQVCHTFSIFLNSSLIDNYASGHWCRIGKARRDCRSGMCLLMMTRRWAQILRSTPFFSNFDLHPSTGSLKRRSASFSGTQRSEIPIKLRWGTASPSCLYLDWLSELCEVPQLQGRVPSLCWAVLLCLCRCKRQWVGILGGNSSFRGSARWVSPSFPQEEPVWSRLKSRSLDAFFENVCELDLVFNFYKVRCALLTYLQLLTYTMYLGLCNPRWNFPRRRNRRDEQGRRTKSARWARKVGMRSETVIVECAI